MLLYFNLEAGNLNTDCGKILADLTCPFQAGIFVYSRTIGPLAAFLVSLIGYRATSTMGSILTAIGLAVGYFCSDFYIFFASTGIISGFGFGLVFLPSICLVTEYFEVHRSLAVGITVSGTGLGMPS